MKSFLSRFIDEKLLRFIIVGIINTLFGTAIMFGCYNLLNLSYWISSGCNYFFGSILSFFLNKYFTFKNTEKSLSQVIRFIINILLCYLIAYGIAKPLIRWLLSGQAKKIQENIAMLVGMCLFTGLNYLGQRFFAFKE